jgi:hypothetical protein
MTNAGPRRTSRSCSSALDDRLDERHPHGSLAAAYNVGESDPGSDMDRRGFILGLGVSTALAGLAASPASADGKRVALIIGNSTTAVITGKLGTGYWKRSVQ